MALSLASLLLTACGSDKPAQTDNAQTTQPADNKTDANTTQETPSTQADPTEKLNAYIECANHGLQSGHKSYNRYTDWADINAGITGKEQNIYGTYEISDHAIDACTNKLTAAIALPPTLADLDKIATSLAATFKAYADVVNQVHKYYEQENYKDDKFEQGKTFARRTCQNL